MNPAHEPLLLILNGGSSSIRFALYATDKSLQLRLRGSLSRIGLGDARLIVKDAAGRQMSDVAVDPTDHRSAIAALLSWLESQKISATIGAVGHRIVHGMTRTAPELITTNLLDELQRVVPFDPEHMPRALELIAATRRSFPTLPQVACFDTAFHSGMPRVAKLLPIPRRFQGNGVERYGFHGLSYAYLMEELVRLGDSAATRGRVILAHLGNGASLAAVRDGRGIDTSMGFTPTAGLMMSTRSGDLDPGLSFYLAQTVHMDAAQFQHMVNHESGLLGVSEISSDVRDLLARESDDSRAAEALALFCYQAKKWIGSFAAALGGLDTLAFAGGIGENAPVIRERICEGLAFLGFKIDASRNAENAALISTEKSRVRVRVIRTDEELMIARSVCRVLDLDL